MIKSVGAEGLNLYAMMGLRGSGGIAAELAEKKGFCARCGAANVEDDLFCRNRGSPLK